MLSALQINYDYSRLESYRVPFRLHTLAEWVKFIGAMFLSKDFELEKEISRTPTESTPFLDQEHPQQHEERGILPRIIPNLSEESLKFFPLLSLIFALDAFAS